MQLLISDANILIDMEEGGLLAPMFSLDCQFAVPDVLFYEELEAQHGHLLGLGLKVQRMQADLVLRVSVLAAQYPKPGRNDLFALALAEHEKCPLLTGDAALRSAAEKEQLEVKGTLWLVEEMVRAGRISIAIAKNAYKLMREKGRRLPWDKADAGLKAIEQGKGYAQN